MKLFTFILSVMLATNLFASSNEMVRVQDENPESIVDIFMIMRTEKVDCIRIQKGTEFIGKYRGAGIAEFFNEIDGENTLKIPEKIKNEIFQIFSSVLHYEDEQYHYTGKTTGKTRSGSIASVDFDNPEEL